jgi:hypothetical protein
VDEIDDRISGAAVRRATIPQIQHRDSGGNGDDDNDRRSYPEPQAGRRGPWLRPAPKAFGGSNQPPNLVSVAFQQLREDGCVADVYVAGSGDKGYDAALG